MAQSTAKLIHLRNLSIRGGRLHGDELACNAGGDGFAPHLRWYFRDLFLEPTRSLTQRDFK